MTTTTSISHEARAADMNVLAPTAAQASGIAAGSPSIAAPTPKRMVLRGYEGFLGLPVWVVLALMWVAGAALLGSCALVTYVVGSLVVQALVGAS